LAAHFSCDSRLPVLTGWAGYVWIMGLGRYSWWMSEYIHKHHNVTALLNDLVFPAKYRRVVFVEDVDTVVKDVDKLLPMKNR
jgi:hypothetical protein